MKAFTIIMILLISVSCLQAETIQYEHGDTVKVPLHANLGVGNDHVRTVIFMGAKKIKVTRTWKEEDLKAEHKANTLLLALRNENIVKIPITALGDNGISYHLEVTVAPSTKKIDPTVMIFPKPVAISKNKGATRSDGVSAGGSWEHETNTTVRLHKHIRGGRKIAQVAEGFSYNAEILAKEKKRVPGKWIAGNDDFVVREYYWWELNNVRASYIGITYHGKLKQGTFSYLEHTSDKTLYLFKIPTPNEPALYQHKSPGVTIVKDQEVSLIHYEKVN